MGGIFKKGYGAVQEEKERQEVARENAGKRLWRFMMKDGEEVELRFLTEEPITFHEHTVKTMRDGKERYDNVVCSGDCPLCDKGDKSSFKGAYLVWDTRPYEYTDKDGKKVKRDGQLRLFIQGQKVLSQLDRISTKYGLSKREVTIIRLGTSTTTTYTVDRGEEKKLSTDEIKNMLPDKIQEMYNGTAESLYAIVEDQLQMLIKGSSASSTTEDEEESDSSALAKEYDKAVIGVEDDKKADEAKPTATVRKPLFKKK